MNYDEKIKELKEKKESVSIDKEAFSIAYENLCNHNNRSKKKVYRVEYMELVYGINGKTLKKILNGERVYYKSKVKANKFIDERL